LGNFDVISSDISDSWIQGHLRGYPKVVVLDGASVSGEVTNQPWATSC